MKRRRKRAGEKKRGRERRRGRQKRKGMPPNTYLDRSDLRTSRVENVDLHFCLWPLRFPLILNECCRSKGKDMGQNRELTSPCIADPAVFNVEDQMFTCTHLLGHRTEQQLLCTETSRLDLSIAWSTPQISWSKPERDGWPCVRACWAAKEGGAHTCSTPDPKGSSPRSGCCQP